MQIILVGAAVLNQIFTGELNTTLVLIGLTVFNAVMGLRQKSKADPSLAALETMMKNIAHVRATARPSRSSPKASCRATWC